MRTPYLCMPFWCQLVQSHCHIRTHNCLSYFCTFHFCKLQESPYTRRYLVRKNRKRFVEISQFVIESNEERWEMWTTFWGKWEHSFPWKQQYIKGETTICRKKSQAKSIGISFLSFEYELPRSAKCHPCVTENATIVHGSSRAQQADIAESASHSSMLPTERFGLTDLLETFTLDKSSKIESIESSTWCFENVWL